MSADGGVVVGTSVGDDPTAYNAHAFRWTQSSNMMVDLGVLPGYDDVRARGVSADGRVVVGLSRGIHHSSTVTHAFRWTNDTGMQSIEDWLADSGVAVSPDLVATDATATNANGGVVVGVLSNYRIFIASSGRGLMTIEDVQDSLRGNATSLNMGRSAGELP